MNESTLAEQTKYLAPWAKEIFPQLLQMFAGKTLDDVSTLITALQSSANESAKCFTELSEKPISVEKEKPQPETETTDKESQAEKLIKSFVEDMEKLGKNVSVQKEKIDVTDLVGFLEKITKMKSDSPFGPGGPFRTTTPWRG